MENAIRIISQGVARLLEKTYEIQNLIRIEKSSIVSLEAEVMELRAEIMELKQVLKDQNGRGKK